MTTTAPSPVETPRTSAPAAIAEPTRARRWLHDAWGLETFGRPAGPWGTLFAPVPLGALGLLLAKWGLWPAGAYPGLADRVGEALWLVLVPFLLATAGQAGCQALAELAWRTTEGRRHLDWSPRRWHYVAGFGAALVPVAMLQLWPGALDAYLELTVHLHAWLGAPLKHLGYDPRLANLAVAGVFPLVYWQAGRIVREVPPGRLLGLQRELARLRGAIDWGPDAWGMAVGDAIDRWLADVAPADSEVPSGGEGQRRHRLRWGALRKELLAAWIGGPAPDLGRANRALLLYRQAR